MASNRTPFRFGEKLRTVRERKGYTLKVVALAAGVSESLVSQIERNRVSPAIDTLLALADALEIDLEYLFEEYRRERPVKLIKADERRQLDENGIKYEEVARPIEGDGAHAIEAYYITLPPGAETRRGSYGHLGREFGIVTEGSAELHYETKVYKLEKGDSISYSATAPHTLVNSGSEQLRALWVVTPPQRFS
ncbi:XRE family transcriptional regulator [Treponema zuelzerae]|uniref:XRE family transcriptional regulator n=1 Tax=Teretinema zuelzerae TaxID=156 RepID=A0AAE3JHV6_9SPIR|nr:XRE family transcriptional regulator [Teretinema zuelzerae]MCD1653473.1 XRE family transcriptional regulator [Teretinema zuelzerae]HPO03328.1 XRE family transcriptional regulator [Treponemataceae bacterium]